MQRPVRMTADLAQPPGMTIRHPNMSPFIPIASIKPTHATSFDMHGFFVSHFSYSHDLVVRLFAHLVSRRDSVSSHWSSYPHETSFICIDSIGVKFTLFCWVRPSKSVRFLR